jgi:uncharacterized protein
MRMPPLSCRPPWWARGPHLQTLAGHFRPSRAMVPPWERQELELADGDHLCIRMAAGRTKRLIHLFHGLGGSADADYMRRTAALFWRQGDSVIAANHRGAGEGRGRAGKPYHMGSTEDLAAVLREGRKLFPDHLQVAVGFSLSATVLLLLLGRDQGLCLPDRAIAVNPVVHMERASLRMSKGLNRLYDLRFVNMLRRQIHERWESGLMTELIKISRTMTLREFDAVFTAPQSGFRDRDDYYAQCTCGPFLREIQVPTVILSSLDDPFATARDLEGLELSPAVHLHAEACGGHMGYLSREIPGKRWLDYALNHYVRELSKPDDIR